MDAIVTSKTVGREVEDCRGLTIFVGSNDLRSEVLIVGIAKFQGNLLAYHRGCGKSLAIWFPINHRDVNLLTRAIYRAVGIDNASLAITVRFAMIEA